MDILKILQDWGLGALVFLGLATQPTYFSDPRYDRGVLWLELQDAFPQTVDTLLSYGVPIQITFHVRLYEGSGFKDFRVIKKVIYNRKNRQAECLLDDEFENQFSLDRAKAWLKQLEIDLSRSRPSQVTIRAELSIEGRSAQEAQGLWGGWPSVVWSP